MSRPSHDIRQPMNKSAWEEYEEYYFDALKDIQIPEDIDASDLMRISSELSAIFTYARFDYMYIKRHYEKLKRQMKRAEKQAYMAVKALGKNDKEREGLVNKYLEDNMLFGYPVTMYDAIDIYEERAFFMEAVLDDLRDKSAKLITGNGALKLDVELQK